MKSPSEMRLMLKCTAIAGLMITTVATNAQSISSQMDEINAGIRARAAADKGKPPQALRMTTNGTTGGQANPACARYQRDVHRGGFLSHLALLLLNV